MRPIDSIKPSPENAKIYRPDKDLKRFGRNLKRGWLHPIGSTEDGWIGDGHRRHAAAKLIGLTEVPCYTIPIRRLLPDGTVNPTFIEMLAEFNNYRLKSAQEQVNEVAVGYHGSGTYSWTQKVEQTSDFPDLLSCMGNVT